MRRAECVQVAKGMAPPQGSVNAVDSDVVVVPRMRTVAFPSGPDGIRHRLWRCRFGLYRVPAASRDREMSIQRSIEFDVVSETGTPPTALSIVGSFLEAGWSIDATGESSFLDVDDVDDFDWHRSIGPSARQNALDAVEKCTLSEVKAGVELTHESEGIIIALVMRENGRCWALVHEAHHSSTRISTVEGWVDDVNRIAHAVLAPLARFQLVRWSWSWVR